MPNYRLNNGAQTMIINECAKLVELYHNNMIADFPLTRGDIQAALLPKEDLERIESITKSGFTVLASSDIEFRVRRSKTMLRSVVLSVSVPYGQRKFYATGEATPARYATEWKPPCESVRVLKLPEDKQAALEEWCIRAVKAARLKMMANKTIRDTVYKCNDSTSLVYHWPALASLCPDPMWRERFRNAPTKNYGRYILPATELPDPKLKAATEIILNTAAMMEAPANQALGAHIRVFQPLPGDRKFT